MQTILFFFFFSCIFYIIIYLSAWGCLGCSIVIAGLCETGTQAKIQRKQSSFYYSTIVQNHCSTFNQSSASLFTTRSIHKAVTQLLENKKLSSKAGGFVLTGCTASIGYISNVFQTFWSPHYRSKYTFLLKQHNLLTACHVLCVVEVLKPIRTVQQTTINVFHVASSANVGVWISGKTRENHGDSRRTCEFDPGRSRSQTEDKWPQYWWSDGEIEGLMDG